MTWLLLAAGIYITRWTVGITGFDVWFAVAITFSIIGTVRTLRPTPHKKGNLK